MHTALRNEFCSALFGHWVTAILQVFRCSMFMLVMLRYLSIVMSGAAPNESFINRIHYTLLHRYCNASWRLLHSHY